MLGLHTVVGAREDVSGHGKCLGLVVWGEGPFKGEK